LDWFDFESEKETKIGHVGVHGCPVKSARIFGVFELSLLCIGGGDRFIVDACLQYAQKTA